MKSTQACNLKSDGNTKAPPVSNNNVDSAIILDCLLKNAACPAIDGQIRTLGGVAYKFACGRPVSGSNLVAPWPTPDLYTCINACSQNPACQGVDWSINGKYFDFYNAVTLLFGSGD